MVFVDTSFFIAALNPRDEDHAEAIAMRSLMRAGNLVTTNHVIGESWTFAGRRFGHHVAAALLRALRTGARYHAVHVAPETEERALDWLLRHDEREYSFVDATSFAIMREKGIEEVLTFDGDFEAVGFRALRP